MLVEDYLSNTFLLCKLSENEREKTQFRIVRQLNSNYGIVLRIYV